MQVKAKVKQRRHTHTHPILSVRKRKSVRRERRNKSLIKKIVRIFGFLFYASLERELFMKWCSKASSRFLKLAA